ncbi:hypothetical protein FRB94_013324 [Tulasnella sp. JGI-2019a]|nr:hypothetical protein FRB94_013324 [Tulasnella sp. JGI-2019a]
MPVIKNLTGAQRGQLWAGYVSMFLFGFYSSLLIVTLWGPISTGRPLRAIGRIIIAVYCITLSRVVVDYCRLNRTLFATAGNPRALKSIDYVLSALQLGLASFAALLCDSLFCWRLYVIWSRSTRIILLPAFLLVVAASGFMTMLTGDFITVQQPNNPSFLTMSIPLWIAVQSVVILYTCYMTIFIAGRLWQVGRAVNRMESLEQPRKNGYSRAISALIQSGIMQMGTRILVIASGARSIDPLMAPIVGRIGLQINGISATLLVLLILFCQNSNWICFRNRGETASSRPQQGPPSSSRIRRWHPRRKVGGRPVRQSHDAVGPRCPWSDIDLMSLSMAMGFQPLLLRLHSA